MTLETRFLINHPIDARKVFDFAREMIGATDEHLWHHEPQGNLWPNPHYRNVAGQGLSALLYVHYGANGERLLTETWDEESDKDRIVPHDPAGYVEVALDTTYSYRGAVGGCGQLHASYVSVLGRWCEQNGWAYHWQNEFTGEWFSDWRLAARELGEAGDEAREWFTSTVLPAITSR